MAAYADLAATINILILFLILALSKFVTIKVLQVKCPFWWADVKTSILRWRSPIYKAAIKKSEKKKQI